MSTEHQKYSVANQMDCIQRYAKLRDIEVVRVYEDLGKSGVQLDFRSGLKDLIQDVDTGRADYTVVLVYDVSRWGRFQDTDESAYYEFICKRSGVRVHYCAEQFENDDSLPSSLLKTIKRTMAGEYSRELSAKVFAGHCRLVKLGFFHGGPCPYGLRRLLVDEHRNPKQILAFGQHKSIHTDRVILVPGPKNELKVIRKIFNLFTKRRMSETGIAKWLNAHNVPSARGRKWGNDMIHGVLTNPHYTGDYVYNRRSFKFKKRHVDNPPEMWIWCKKAIQPIVSLKQFRRAAALIASRPPVSYTKDELLIRLKELWARSGALSAKRLYQTRGMPRRETYIAHFGSLVEAFRLVGYPVRRDFRYIEQNRELRKWKLQHCEELIKQLHSVGATVERASGNLLTINGEFTAVLRFIRYRRTPEHNSHWCFRLDNKLQPDLTIATRIQHGNRDILDYYLIPHIETLTPQLELARRNDQLIDAYRFGDLSTFFNMARRVPLSVAALIASTASDGYECPDVQSLHTKWPRPPQQPREAVLEGVSKRKELFLRREYARQCKRYEFAKRAHTARTQLYLASVLLCHLLRDPRLLMVLRTQNVTDVPEMFARVLREPRWKILPEPEAIDMKDWEVFVSSGFRLLAESHGRDMLVLLLACKYFRYLLGNQRIENYLCSSHSHALKMIRWLLRHVRVQYPVGNLANRFSSGC